MPHRDYFSLRVPVGTTDRIRRLADPIGISVSEWCRRAIGKYATGGAVAGSGSEIIVIPRSHSFGWSHGVIRFAIAAALNDAELRAPTPPVIDPAEEWAARGAVITSAEDDDQ